MTTPESSWSRVLARINQAQHSLILGGRSLPLPSDGLPVLRVDCDVFAGPAASHLGPVLEAERRVKALLGEAGDGAGGSLLDLATRRMVTGLRRHILGDEVEQEPPGARLTAALGRLRRQTRGPLAILFYAVETADAATLRYLQELLAPGAAPAGLSVVLVCREPAAPACLEGIVAAMDRVAGASGVIGEPAPPAGPAPAPAFDWAQAPSQLRWILRAAALVGTTFEAALVADLLQVDELAVLEQLQEAADRGLAIEDRGDGRFVLDAAILASARSGLLRSLESAWNRRLAQLLGGPHPSEPELAEPVSLQPETAPSLAPVEPPAPPVPPAVVPPAEAASPIVDFMAEAMPLPAQRPTAPSPEDRRAAERRDRPGAGARAAVHAAAAGDHDQAAEHLVRAASDSLGHGLFGEARELASRALELLERLPDTAERKRLRAASLIALGQSLAGGAEPGPGFTLGQARTPLEEAVTLARASADPQLQAEAARALAQVCYDIGGPSDLERALAELTEASRVLVKAGHSLEGARLLNDQAAVWVRLGDPVRAHHLLEQSREVFARRAGSDPMARREMAETDHLMARLVLHVPSRPGREQDAFEAGLRHAASAEAAYAELQLPWELARVWETRGRLELLAGRSQKAAEALGQAVEEQQQSGDLIGLARTAGAFADVLLEQGDVRRALLALQDSIELNLEKGSVLGLRYNREALARMARVPGPHREAALALEQRLAKGGEHRTL